MKKIISLLSIVVLFNLSLGNSFAEDNGTDNNEATSGNTQVMGDSDNTNQNGDNIKKPLMPIRNDEKIMKPMNNGERMKNMGMGSGSMDMHRDDMIKMKDNMKNMSPEDMKKHMEEMKNMGMGSGSMDMHRDNMMKMKDNMKNMSPEDMKKHMEEMKNMGIGSGSMDKFRDDMMKMREEKMQEVNKNMNEMKKNLESFKGEHEDEMKQAFSDLSEDVKNQLKTIDEEFRTNMEALKDEYKDKMQDETSRKELFDKMEDLRNKHFDDIKELVGTNPDVSDLVEQRKAIFEQNKELRSDNQKAREEFRGNRSDLIIKYKSNFITKLGTKLDSIPSDKLDTILGKIDKAITMYEKNTKIAQDKKDSLISQLVALKEIVQEKIDASSANVEEINIDELLQ